MRTVPIERYSICLVTACKKHLFFIDNFNIIRKSRNWPKWQKRSEKIVDVAWYYWLEAIDGVDINAQHTMLCTIDAHKTVDTLETMHRLRCDLHTLTRAQAAMKETHAREGRGGVAWKEPEARGKGNRPPTVSIGVSVRKFYPPLFYCISAFWFFFLDW